uniref:Ig-like domain-containing protein n=1 Tax=Branchiostoma floridae TaxID=7739 RepID=C3ZB20_BRAFL|eukprot:XP_002594046.1 hypothetical protein BRAFLDRAFT_68514 [Branchiostoma floridae]
MAPFKKNIPLVVILALVHLTLYEGCRALPIVSTVPATICHGFEPATCSVYEDHNCLDQLQDRPANSERLSCAVCNTPNPEHLRSLHCAIPPSAVSLKLTDIASTKFSMASVEKLPHIRLLDIEGANLNGLAAGGFSGFPSLERIQISQTAMRVIRRGWFNGLVNVESLNLALNLISWIHPGAFQGLEILSNLNLSYNQLTHIEEHYFSGLQHLKNLDLSFNKVRVIEKGAFKNIYFTLLDLKSNRLTNVERCWFLGIIGMYWLSLEENMITTIEPGAFSSLDGISALHLRENRLVVLWESWLRGLAREDSKYKTILLWGLNTLRCTCANRWFAAWSKTYFEIIPGSIPCLYPLGFGGQDLFSIPPKNLSCPSPVVKIRQDADNELQFRCQATWEEEESSVFWTLPDNTTILLPGLGEVEGKSKNLTSQYINISFEHTISACGWTWITSSMVAKSCSYGQTAPNYAVRTVSVLALHESRLREWKGLSICCGVKSLSSDVLTKTQITAQGTTEEEHGIIVASPTCRSNNASTFSSFTIATLAPFKIQDHPTRNMARTVDNSTPIASTTVSSNYAHVTTQVVIVLLPGQTQTYSNLNWYIMGTLCALTVTLSLAVCVYLLTHSRQHDNRHDGTMDEQRGHNQPNDYAMPGTQREQSINNMSNDPYYSTIDDDENDAVHHYGISKACAQYGQTVERSCVVGEQCPQVYDFHQTFGEETVPDGGEVHDREDRDEIDNTEVRM